MYTATPGMLACGSVKAWTTPPNVSSAQRAPAAVHLRLEGIALGLRRDRIGGAMHGEHRGLDVAALGGLRRRKRSVHRHHRLHLGAGAREVEHVEAAEAEADRGAAVDVADRAPVGLLGQGVERSAMRRRMPGTSAMNGRRNSMGFSVPTGPLPSPNMSATNTT